MRDDSTLKSVASKKHSECKSDINDCTPRAKEPVIRTSNIEHVNNIQNNNVVTESRAIYKWHFSDGNMISNEVPISNHMKIHAETYPQCDICAEICNHKT